MRRAPAAIVLGALAVLEPAGPRAGARRGSGDRRRVGGGAARRRPHGRRGHRSTVGARRATRPRRHARERAGRGGAGRVARCRPLRRRHPVARQVRRAAGRLWCPVRRMGAGGPAIQLVRPVCAAGGGRPGAVGSFRRRLRARAPGVHDRAGVRWRRDAADRRVAGRAPFDLDLAPDLEAEPLRRAGRAGRRGVRRAARGRAARRARERTPARGDQSRRPRPRPTGSPTRAAWP